MKRLLIAVALLAVTVGLCAAGRLTLRWQTDRWLSLLDETEKAWRAGDLQAASDTARRLSDAVSKENRWLAVFVSHEPLEAVEESAALLPVLIKLDRTETSKELARCRLRLEQLAGLEDMSAGNIL